MKESTITVSIICCAYNHEPYIRQCLDGFMMQQTDFAFEVLIHDDASSDNTANIIREYEAKYPDIIKPIYQTENQYQKKTGILKTFQYPRAQGKYIALCEGDDYWIDPLKLQKQVDFLESHPDYVMCSHNYDEYFQKDKTKVHSCCIKTSFTYDLKYLINGGWAFQPLTVMFRLDKLDINYYKYSNSKDMSLFYALLKNGKGYYMSDSMAIYRIHNAGVWSGMNADMQFISNFYNRIGIYEVEKTENAAFFILSLWNRPWSRKIMLRNLDILIKCVSIFKRYWGTIFTIKILFYRLLFVKKQMLLKTN